MVRTEVEAVSGPGIIDIARPRVTSVEGIRGLILKGIADRGMPAFRISEEEAGGDRRLRGVKLQAACYRIGDRGTCSRAIPRRASDSSTARAIGAGCHMVRGQGGILGPDLSAIGRDRQPAQIEQILRDPGITADQPGSGRQRLYAIPTGSDCQAPRWPGDSRHRQERKRVRDGGVGHGSKAAPAAERPDCRNQSRKSLMPKLEASPYRGSYAIWSNLSQSACSEIPRPRRRLRLRRSGSLACRLPKVAHPPTGAWPTYNGNLSGNRFSTA